MRADPEGLFDVDVWRPELENYGTVTGLTVAVYDRHARAICTRYRRHRSSRSLNATVVRLGLWVIASG
jgi:hypothetical protein